MKTKFVIVFFLLVFSFLKVTANVTEAQASEILQSHFVKLVEVKDIYPDLPATLEIPFSEEALKTNRSGYLVPVKMKNGFEYLFFRANFENEISMLKGVDTLDIETAKEVLMLIKRLRPWFPGRAESNLPFKYFFRAKDISKMVAVSYDGKNFIVVDWPNNVELGMMNKDYISYLTRNKNGVEIQFETTPLPANHPKVNNQQSVFVLTLFSCRE